MSVVMNINQICITVLSCALVMGAHCIVQTTQTPHTYDTNVKMNGDPLVLGGETSTFVPTEGMELLSMKPQLRKLATLHGCPNHTP